ncbi:MAG TPA: hypothetical protein VFD43_02505 [Planctomycetota bacterium]|nr:hypothetical protein [Planctomycetota bacterium]
MSARVLRPGLRALPALLLALLLGGCAWSNRANRPVWNAFEANLVPEDTTGFYATLPLTLPGGLVCILIDCFIVHPVHVADDAWADAGELWHGLDWDTHYYTQLVVLPLRLVGTPIVFVGMFLARSLFDVPPHDATTAAQEAAVEAAAAEAEEQALERRWLERLTAMARATPDSAGVSFRGLDPPSRWSDALQRAYADALERGRPLDRLRLYEQAQRHELAPWRADPSRGLRDPEPVVRFLLLDGWPARVEVPAEIRSALRSDPDEAVRQLARQRWP